MTIALYIGRFQPLHKGHLEYIKRILKKEDMIKICIGSRQEKNTFKNPFSIAERKKMILSCLKSENIMMEKVRLFTARDYPGKDDLWLKEIKKAAGKFDNVYAGENKVIYDIFKKAGYRVFKANRIMGIIGTRIREKICKGEDWKHLVPKSVYDFILSVNGEERIRKLSQDI